MFAAIATVVQTTKLKKFGMIGMDACIMSNWEAMVSIANHTELVLASEQNEPGHGWDWTAFKLLMKPGVSMHASNWHVNMPSHQSTMHMCCREQGDNLVSAIPCCDHGGTSWLAASVRQKLH
jgi:hypothetical protein